LLMRDHAEYLSRFVFIRYLIFSLAMHLYITENNIM